MNHVDVVTLDHNSQSHLLIVLLKLELTDDISIRLLVLERSECDTSGWRGKANTIPEMFYCCHQKASPLNRQPHHGSQQAVCFIMTQKADIYWKDGPITTNASNQVLFAVLSQNTRTKKYLNQVTGSVYSRLPRNLSHTGTLTLEILSCCLIKCSLEATCCFSTSSFTAAI